jgi:hypothetical protein
MKPRIRALINARKDELRKSPPKSRDRLRHRVRVLEIVAILKREKRAS